MTAALEVRGLGYELPGKREGGRGGHLVQDVSFTVAAGETLVLLGRSGSGKTTTLKLINRLLEPTAGEVVVAGRSEEHTSELQSRFDLVCRLLLEKKNRHYLRLPLRTGVRRVRPKMHRTGHTSL